LAGLYAAVAGIAHAMADSMLFQPSYGSFHEPTGGLRIKTKDGELSALYLPNPAAKYTLWYFHGNAEDLGDIQPKLEALRGMGYAVFAYDYPGYGLSTGTPSEKKIYESTQRALEYLRETHALRPEQLVLYGRSLGGGPAVELATREPVAGLILESAFMSAYRVMTRWRLLPFDKFENLRKIKNVHCPVLVMHGTEDRVVAFVHGEKLFAEANEPKQKFWVQGAGHNNLTTVAGPLYRDAVMAFKPSPIPASK
jgi:fermentation-respiration switch protein FrsA (DUF1100 family)